MRMLTIKPTHLKEDKKDLIYEDLVQSFKNIEFQGMKRNKSWCSALRKYA